MAWASLSSTALCISGSLELVLWYCNNFYSNSVLFEVRNVVTSLLGLVIVSNLSHKGLGRFTGRRVWQRAEIGTARQRLPTQRGWWSGGGGDGRVGGRGGGVQGRGEAVAREGGGRNGRGDLQGGRLGGVGRAEGEMAQGGGGG
jgi:hypothetical protein